MSEMVIWQLSVFIFNLLKCVVIMVEICCFFVDCGVFEVEMFCMSQVMVIDIYLFLFEMCFVGSGYFQGMNFYLMISLEYYMKCLLVVGCGLVFQLCCSFCNEEMG